MPDPNNVSTRWGQARTLFNAICDLPPEEQTRRLAELSPDPALRAEVMALLGAQTEAFQTALLPLHDLAARLDGEELGPGDRIGHWTLSERLGRGGMGSVFVAERDDGLFRQRVALKILRRPTDAEAADLLEAERAVLAGLVHPGIARLYDGGTTPAGLPFLVMEFVDGVPLDAWCRARQPDLEERLALFDRLCDAVAHAHRQLVVHCDLKPANVLVRADGQPMLLDFGIARWIGAEPTRGETELDGIASAYCTPAYASPEQIAGQKPVVATDVFALGVMLAELLSDATLGRSAEDASTPVPRPSTRAAGAARAWRHALRGDLDAIVAKATALQARHRYPDVAALRDDLNRHRAHLPVSARPVGLLRRSVLFLRRYRGGALAASVGVLMAAGFTLQLVRERDRAREAAEAAEQVSRFMVGAFDAANVRRDGGQRDVRARDVLRSGADRIARDLADQPAAQARLLLAIGRAYASLGEPVEAIPLLAQAIELSEADPRQWDVTIDALQQQSVIAGNAGRGEEALDLAERAVSLRERSEDNRPESVAESLNHLGLALRAVRRFDEAREALGESLRLRKGLGAGAEGEVVSALNNLALVERLDGRPAEAVPIYQESIAMARAMGSVGEFSLQNALQGLGQALMQQRRFDEALVALRESHGLALRLYGEDSQTTAAAVGELGILLWDTGDHAAAEPLLREALALTRRRTGDDSMPTAISMNNLGLLLEERGDAESALPLVEGSLAIRRAHFAADDPAVRRATFNVARVQLARGRPKDARALTADYLEALLADPQTATREWWTQVLLGLELAWRTGEAPDRVFETLSAFPPPAAEGALAVIGWRLPRLQAELLAADGRHAAAQAAIERALAAARAHGSPHDLALTALTAARIALAAGDRGGSRRLLAEAQPILDAILVADAPLRRDAAALAARLTP